MITKDGLQERRNGRGGTLVRLLAAGYVMPAGVVYVVKDLMERPEWNRPDQVGIGPLDRGVAFGARLEHLEIARVFVTPAQEQAAIDNGECTHTGAYRCNEAGQHRFDLYGEVVVRPYAAVDGRQWG